MHQGWKNILEKTEHKLINMKQVGWVGRVAGVLQNYKKPENNYFVDWPQVLD